MFVDSKLLARERELEDDMSASGVERYEKMVAQAVEKGQEATTTYGLEISRRLILPVAERITEFLEAATQGAGRRHAAVKMLKGYDAETVAFLTVKHVINTVSAQANKLTTVALKVAGAIEDEARYAHYQENAGKLYSHMLKDLQSRTSHREWQRRVMIHVMNRNGFAFDEWKKSDKLHLGQALIHCMIDATDLFYVRNKVVGRSRQSAFLEVRQELVDLISSKNARSALLSPTRMPMVVPPAPWTGPYGGGYLFFHRPLPLITGRVNHNYLEELGNMEDQLGDVYEALNTIQSVPWKINTKVLDVLRDCWDRDLGHGKLPPAEMLEAPVRPFDIDTNEESRKEWRGEASKIHALNSRLVSKRVMVNSLISVADKYVNDEAIYFPHQMDFRGRIYACPQHLNPQGHDVAKGLLTFAKGKPIEDEKALGWLMIHAANTFGFDKVSMEDRVAWVEEHIERIQAIAADPLADLWWSEADKPWQFLATCFELAGVFEHGWGYVSHLPVALDGSCNGLQHFSALLKDPVGGRATNLVPSATPADIYQEVADRTNDALLKIVEHVGETFHELSNDEMLAQQWLDYGISRKITKRPVMIVPYSGTMFAARKYIDEFIRGEIAEGVETPWVATRKNEDDPPDVYKAAFFLAPIVWRAIEETVVAARDGMAWLRHVAKAASKAEMPLTWTTPDGFPVFQAYWATNEKRVKTRMGDTLVYLSLQEKIIGKLNGKEQENGVSPNLIHSLDAAAMRQYVLLAKDNGVENFSLIHDSYGTLAADTDISSACLRHAFVNLYEEEPVLERFLNEIKVYLPEENFESIPPLPPLGDLNIEDIRDAEYFFA